jgi:hypothetical protein
MYTVPSRPLVESLESRTLLSASPQYLTVAPLAAHRAKTHTPANIVGSFTGTLKSGKTSDAITIDVADESSTGVVTGILTTGTGATAVASNFTGQVKGHHLTLTYTDNGAAAKGNGKINKDATTIRGGVVAATTPKKTHGKFTVTKA